VKEMSPRFDHGEGFGGQHGVVNMRERRRMPDGKKGRWRQYHILRSVAEAVNSMTNASGIWTR
jgi:hypothetical protein